jgi:Tfp pilus assembly protein PilE
MSRSRACQLITNRKGFTFLTAIFMVMIIGIMLGMTGHSWKMIMKREREKELLFRGSQIKEAIENWYNPQYTIPGVPPRARVHALMDLKDLLQDPYALTPVRYLPHTYATELNEKNEKCAPNCAKIKLLQDPITGKEWTLVRGSFGDGNSAAASDAQGAGIIGVASKSDEAPIRTNFKDTALEKMGAGNAVTAQPGTPSSVSPFAGVGEPSQPLALGGKITKYSEWKFVADKANMSAAEHGKLYRAYRESW